MKNKSYLSIVAPFIILIIWLILTQLNLFSNLILPTPLSVLKSFYTLILEGTLLKDSFITLLRVFISLGMSLIIGIPLGLVMGYFDKIYILLEFIIDFFRNIPATALFPLIMLLFGIGDISKIIVGSWSAIMIMIINSMYGVRLTKKAIIESARLMNINGLALFMKILLPGALSHIFTGIRISISLILAIMVVTEMFIGTTCGLGYRIMEAQSIYNTSIVYAVILLVGILGFSINKGIVYLERNIIHWKGQ